MGFQCGIVGLPNVGKSTLFNALTRASVPAENYPFCTKDPNVGIVMVPDERLQVLASFAHPEKIVPTTTQFVDIAGLVKGASEGEGLGNRFLAHIRETDAIVHVVRCFEDDNIVHVTGSVDPKRDIETVETELILADLETIQKRLEKTAPKTKAGDKNAILEYELLQKTEEHLGKGRPARILANIQLTPTLPLLTAKPILYIANVDEETIQGKTPSSQLIQLQTLAKEQNALVIPMSVKLEAELSELSPEDKKEYLASLNLKESGVDQLINAGYQLLQLQTFFTAGPKEVRAWTIRKGCTAPEAAGVIHTDFEKGFIRAEVIAYEDYVRYHGEQGARDAGKWRLEGKDYIVQEGDVMHFRFQV